MAFISSKMWQFTYFSKQLGERDWQGKDVLDFGGNIGNMLQDRNSTIDEERYWCIDIDEEAVEMGRRSYPKSHWLSYNRYCFFFNPHGVPHLPLPEVGQAFDYIVAYSVFTNTPRTDLIELVDALLAVCRRTIRFPISGGFSGQNRVLHPGFRPNNRQNKIDFMAKSTSPTHC